jgi:hypothetical protein
MDHGAELESLTVLSGASARVQANGRLRIAVLQLQSFDVESAETTYDCSEVNACSGNGDCIATNVCSCFEDYDTDDCSVFEPI